MLQKLKRKFSLPRRNGSRLLKYRKKEERKQNLRINLLCFLVSFLYYYQLEICNKNFLFNGFVFTFVNIFMIFSLITVLGLFTVRKWIASAVVGVLSTIVAIINFYTVLFRNQPASPLDIHNIGTAMDVIGSYKPGFHFTVILTVLLFAMSIFVILKVRKLEENKRYTLNQYGIRIMTTIGLTFVFFYVVFFAKYSIKPKLTLVWSWEESYHEYGYLASSQEMLVKSFNVVRKPDNYDEVALKKIADSHTGKTTEKERKPDIILVLNETFFDLENVTNLEVDKEVTPFINNLENKISGYCYVPGVGGGTNRSEYELLTSNTLNLMPGITPFSFLDLNGANSIVSFLENAGYTTWASHYAPSLNYSRGNAYPRLGFDKSMFDVDFKEKPQFGKRPYATDEYIYDVLVEEYKKMGKGPRFMYTLTIQNHGGWDMNPPEKDIVHAKADFGVYDAEIDEYLSCVALSDAAFGKLVNYYKTVDRDVIICMVGDHAPSWIKEVQKPTEDKFEKTLVCATPFVIWANFDLKSENVGYTSLPYMVPLLLKNGGLNLSPFYDFMLKMYEKYPVISANNYYIDNNNVMHSYTSEDCAEEINTYFDMVYNNAASKSNRIDGLFKRK